LVIVWEFSLLTSALVFFCLRWIGRRKLAAMLPVADEVAEVVCRGNAYVMPILQSWFKRTGAKWDRPAIETLTKVHQRLKAVARAILCRVHLTRFETRPHEAHPDKVPVFCCRLCGEPANMMLGVRELICVVDTRQSVRLPEGAAPENGVLRAYWVRTEPLFDFDVVEVVHTDDFEAERFCIQVGNDTDPFRARRYRKTTCRIAADCPLSENTWRILRATFGKVEPAPSPGGNA
jgi:hypothetical protein